MKTKSDLPRLAGCFFRPLWALTIWGVLLCSIGLAVEAVQGSAAAEKERGLVCCTWNMANFPVSEKEKLGVDVEAKVRKAGLALADSLRQMGYGKEGAEAVVFVQEILDGTVLSNLAVATGLSGLHVAAVSDYQFLNGDEMRQQDGILTTLPVKFSGYDTWRSMGKLYLPRGFVYALTECGGQKVGLYGLHMKSNKAGIDGTATENLRIREYEMDQLLGEIGEAKGLNPGLACIVAGDFNTNLDDAQFRGEKTLSMLGDMGGFESCFEGVPKEKRVTINPSKLYPGATFDYIFTLGFEKQDCQVFCTKYTREISDHNIVGARYEMPEASSLDNGKETETEALKKEVERLRKENRILRKKVGIGENVDVLALEQNWVKTAVVAGGATGEVESQPWESDTRASEAMEGKEAKAVKALNKVMESKKTKEAKAVKATNGLIESKESKSEDAASEGEYWMSSTGKRHRRGCRYFGQGDGHKCGKDEGVACKMCKG